MKRVLLVLFAILLLVSCSRTKASIALVSEDGMEFYSIDAKSSAIVTFGKETTEGLCQVSGLAPKGLANVLSPQTVVYEMDSELFEKRQELYSTLMVITDTSSITSMWKEHKKELEDSAFLTTLSTSEGSFDEALAGLVEKSKAEFDTYRAEDALEENCDYGTAIVFLKRWIKAIIG